MRVEAHNRLGKPVVFEATRVLIRDSHGNPIAVAVQIDPNHTVVSHCDDPEFPDLLQALGLPNTTLTSYLDPRDLPKLDPR